MIDPATGAVVPDAAANPFMPTAAAAPQMTPMQLGGGPAAQMGHPAFSGMQHPAIMDMIQRMQAANPQMFQHMMNPQAVQRWGLVPPGSAPPMSGLPVPGTPQMGGIPSHTMPVNPAATQGFAAPQSTGGPGGMPMPEHQFHGLGAGPRMY
jgi:hypothetical protein